MAGFTLKLVFSGLIAYVSHSDGTGMSMLLPEIKSPAHELTLTVQKKYLVEEETTLQFKAALGKEEGLVVAHLPPNYDMAILETSAQPPAFRYDRCNWMAPAMNMFGRRVCALSLSEYLPSATQVEPECLSPTPGAACHELRMRVRLKHGKVSPRQHSPLSSDRLNARELEWIDKKGKAMDRWAPEAMELRRRMAGDKVTIELVPLKGGQRHKIVVDRPSSGDDLKMHLDYSPSITVFCDCDSDDKSRPDLAPTHLAHLSCLAEGREHITELPAELSSISEKLKIKQSCEAFCTKKAVGLHPVICYGAQIP